MHWILGKLALFILTIWLASVSLPNLIEKKQRNFPVITEEDEVKYLPKGPHLKLLSLGYSNALSNFLWFNTVSYFGKHYRGDKKYRWLYHMCDLITTLDPKNQPVFVFGALMLGWEAQLPEESTRLLNKAISLHPDYWGYYYLRGFSAYLLRDDVDKAISDFKFAATLPDAPAMLASIAAKKMTHSRADPASAVSFLEDMLKATTDPMTKSILKRRLDEAKAKLEASKK